MKKIYKNRIYAYIVDLILISLIMILINKIPFSNNNALYQSLNDINDGIINNKISFRKYLSDYGHIIYQIDSNNIINNLINLIIMIVYFIIIPFCNGGRTLGLHLFNLKIERNNYKKITVLDLFIRCLIVN
ncbi:MAG: RDD family protein, partial [Bacilli bacterium]|nr:RDD family protein [Bacilli bacterium]